MVASFAKAAATALIVVFASTAAEALGPIWGAIVASLPVSAGPAYVFLAMQYGPDFIAASSLNSAAANAATGLFLITYAVTAKRLPLYCNLAAALAAWLAAALTIRLVSWTPVSAAALNLAVYCPGLVFLSKSATATPGSAPRAQRQRFDLLFRAASVAAFVSLVIGISAMVGPAATGIAAVFPVSLISLIVILLRRLGGPAAARVATGALFPMLGFGVMLLVLHLAVVPLGVWVAIELAIATCALWSSLVLFLHVRLRLR